MSKITVTEIAGQTSGSDQNLVKLPSNNTLQVDNIVNRGGDNDSGIDLGTNDVIRFKTANAERMRLDAGGSVLLGQTTPTDLHNTWNHLIMGNRGSIISQNGAGGIDGMSVSYNAYIDSDTGGYSYIATDEASILTQQNGILQYRNAGSGTAGNAVTFDTKLQIDADGRVTMPKQPSFHATLSSNQTGYNATASSGTQDYIEYNSDVYDIGNNHSGGTFTAPVDGTYYFRAEAYANVGFSQSWWLVNGARAAGSDLVYTGATSFAHNSVILKLATNDTVRYRGYVSGQTNATIYAHANHTWFRGMLLG